MADALSLDTYVIGRPDKFSLTVAYGCYDKEGNKLFDIKRKLLGEQYEIIDSGKKVVGEIHRKMISITPTYELYDSDKKMIGKVIEEMNITASLTGGTKVFDLQDSSGNKVASVSVKSPLAILTQVLGGNTSSLTNAYDILATDGTTSIAKISRQMPPRTGIVVQNMANFVLQISAAGSIPVLALVEFTVAVDHLYSSSSNVQRGVGMGMGNMGGIGPGGFGGGGFNIKI